MNTIGGRRTDIPVGIALDYPIGWSFSMVLRDFVQNFYDEIGEASFQREFDYHYGIEQDSDAFFVRTSSKNHPFSHEWLSYVGASTKTGKPDANIGMYGEGFKLSLLRIVQFGGMDLVMHSQNWEIRPSIYQEYIDGQPVQLLGYELSSVLPDNITSLTITGIPAVYETVLRDATLDFFYPGNALFGEYVGGGEEYTIYRRSETPIPCNEPHEGLKGILYQNRLARGRLDIPFVINCQGTEYTDLRSRPVIPSYRAYRLLNLSAAWWSPQISAVMLRELRQYWSQTPSGPTDMKTKYYLICQLVRNAAREPAVAAGFGEEMAACGYLERKGEDPERNRIIEEATLWWGGIRDKKLVNPIFRLLGAENLVERYLQSTKIHYREGETRELARYQCLCMAVKAVMPFLNQAEFPALLIAPCGALQHDPLPITEKRIESRKRRHGMKYRITALILCAADFEDGAFLSSYLKLADTMLQIYGKPASEKRNAMLTELGTRFLEHADEVTDYQHQWDEL